MNSEILSFIVSAASSNQSNVFKPSQVKSTKQSVFGQLTIAKRSRKHDISFGKMTAGGAKYLFGDNFKISEKDKDTFFGQEIDLNPKKPTNFVRDIKYYDSVNSALKVDDAEVETGKHFSSEGI